MRRSWISRGLVAAAVVALALPTLTNAGPLKLFKRRQKAEPEPVVQPVVEPEPEPPPPPPTLSEPLFEGSLPVDVGPHPEGLANLSAQGCHGCHPAAFEDWRSGPHGPADLEVLLDVASRSGASACTVCHLPLASQHSFLPSWESPRSTAENDSWNATLQMEGVTCVACHLRDGRVAVGTAEAARRLGPHTSALAEDLTTSETCGACHQLTWPGADLPLYDTYGEWSRSAWAAAGVGCSDCHTAREGHHVASIDAERAVSVLVEAPGSVFVRGGEPMVVTVTLQNTGAGHAFPTGTPFRGVRVLAGLTPPGESELAEPLLQEDLVRTLSNEPPWSTRDDTRLAAGSSRQFEVEVQVPDDKPAGRWAWVVQLVPTLQGSVDGPPMLVRRLPLDVQ
ncbi:MAG: hypothetical protein KTR31_10625 [Myxococcales bacterium]|nr:hypothetical protein [Myxococcales bacterium]